MARFLTGLILFCFLLAGASLAVDQYNQAMESEYGPEYFFAIQGEVSGQAAPRVQSVRVNGRSVAIGSDLTFHTRVSLGQGEKYLVITTKYKNLNFTKKYLVIRHPKAPKTFKISLPQQEFKKIVGQTKTKTKRRLLPRKISPRPTPKPISITKAKPIKPAKPAAKPVAVKNIKQVSYAFKQNEFKDAYHTNSLARAIEADDYWLTTTAPKGSISWVNEVLRQPGFYETWRSKGKLIVLNATAQQLIRETSQYRGKQFSQLTKGEQQKIIWLNRLILEATYPLFSPKYQGKELAASHTSWLGFDFVAELEAGRFLIVRHVDGKYFSAIYVIKESRWIPLQEISYEELVNLLNNDTVPLFIKPQN